MAELLGAELRTLARVGSQRLLAVEWWQPLAPGAPWYLAPSVAYQASSLDVYEQGRRTLRIGYDFTTAALTFGRQLSNWGDVQLGVERRVGDARSLVVADGSSSRDAFAENVGYAQFQADTLDGLALPSRGTLLQLRVERSFDAAGQEGHANATVLGLQAFTVDAWAGHVYGEWSRSRSGLAPLSLGGFLRLSGTPRASVGGNTSALGRVVMARRIGEMPAGLGGAVRTGFSLELGRGDGPGMAPGQGDLRKAGSGFVSVDTRFGPAFLAFGATRGVGSALYLFLGPFW